jgi:hypothetical protein
MCTDRALGHDIFRLSQIEVRTVKFDKYNIYINLCFFTGDGMFLEDNRNDPGSRFSKVNQWIVVIVRPFISHCLLGHWRD